MDGLDGFLVTIFVEFLMCVVCGLTFLVYTDDQERKWKNHSSIKLPKNLQLKSTSTEKLIRLEEDVIVQVPNGIKFTFDDSEKIHYVGQKTTCRYDGKIIIPKGTMTTSDDSPLIKKMEAEQTFILCDGAEIKMMRTVPYYDDKRGYTFRDDTIVKLLHTLTVQKFF